MHSACFSKRSCALPPSLAEEDRAFLRFEVDLMVACELLAGPLDELTFWAQRAAIGARRVAAIQPSSRAARVRAEVARVRARTAWERWDDEEIDQELRPWPARR